MLSFDLKIKKPLLIVTVIFTITVTVACSKFSVPQNATDSDTATINTESTETITPQETEEQNYHELISAGINGNEISDDADKVVCFYTYDQKYTRAEVPSELRGETANEIRYIVKITERQKFSGTYSGIGTQGSAFRRDYQLDLFDRIKEETVISERIIGSDPPFITESGKDGYGEFPSEEELKTWISEAYDTKDNNFRKNYIFHDFKYSLPVIYSASENESDIDGQSFETYDEVIFINYFEKSDLITNLPDFAEFFKSYIEEKNGQPGSVNLQKFSFGKLNEENGFCYFTSTEEKIMAIYPIFHTFAFYETESGYYAVQLSGTEKTISQKHLALARTIKIDG